MTVRIVELRLRLFLLGLAAFMCVGTVVELWLTEHTQELIQWLPFVLCGLGLATIAAVLLRPRRATIWILRIVMGVVTFSSVIGVIEHVRSNLEVVLEVKPSAALVDALWEAVRGAAPLLAPGTLALMALIAIAATYYHPALGSRNDI